MKLFKKKNKIENRNNPTNEPGYSVEEIPEEIPEYCEELDDYQAKKPGLGIGILVGAVAMFVIVCVVGVILFNSLTKNISIQTSSETSEASSQYQTKLNIILAYLDAYYLNDYDVQDVEDGMSRGVLSSIGDKYAQYYSAEEFAELEEEISGAYSGIGVGITLDEEGRVVIYKVYEGTPSEEAGLRVNDIIVEADGVREFETTDELVSIVRGLEGTTVDITVERDGEEKSFTIERRSIELPTIYSEMLENDIGYIYISEFDTVTTSQFKSALDTLEAQGMKAVILDLRDNPGGDYDTVVAMADRVLPEGPIISTKDKNGNVVTEYSDGENQLTIPCCALVNGNSASAAELFTAALQDYEIATIVGKTTYGKGVVQSIFKLSDGSGMKFTTSKYYTPNGRDIDGVGVVPDVEVDIPEEAYEDGILDETEDTQLQKAIEILTEATGE